MIEGNRIKFGYGDICVGASAFKQQVTFQQFKPPAEPGENVPYDVEFTSEQIVIDLDLNSSFKIYNDILRSMRYVKERKITEFEIKGYILDFSNYNEKSIDVVNRALNEAARLYMMTIAA